MKISFYSPLARFFIKKVIDDKKLNFEGKLLWANDGSRRANFLLRETFLFIDFELVRFDCTSKMYAQDVLSIM